MRTLALAFVAVMALSSAGETKKIEVRAGSLVELRPLKPSAVMVMEPWGLEYKTYSLEGGSQVIVFCMAKHKRVLLTTFCDNGDAIPLVTQYVITPGGKPPSPRPTPGPTPVPGPDKPLSSKFAEWIRNKGRKAEIAADTAQAYAANYETIASKIAAVSSFSPDDAARELVDLNNRTGTDWKMPVAAKPIQTHINTELNKVATDVGKMGEVMEQVAEGLRAI